MCRLLGIIISSSGTDSPRMPSRVLGLLPARRRPLMIDIWGMVIHHNPKAVIVSAVVDTKLSMSFST